MGARLPFGVEDSLCAGRIPRVAGCLVSLAHTVNVGTTPRHYDKLRYPMGSKKPRREVAQALLRPFRKEHGSQCRDVRVLGELGDSR